MLTTCCSDIGNTVYQFRLKPIRGGMVYESVQQLSCPLFCWLITYSLAGKNCSDFGQIVNLKWKSELALMTSSNVMKRPFTVVLIFNNLPRSVLSIFRILRCWERKTEVGQINVINFCRSETVWSIPWWKERKRSYKTTFHNEFIDTRQ